jgi:hypothetical protein
MKPAIFNACVLLLLLTAVCATPALAQSEPRVEVLSLAGFDPTLGKQFPITSFDWPSHRQLCTLVRYQTSGYTKRKGVTVFLALTDRDGRVVYKYERELQLHAGPHELIAPKVFELAEMFGSQRLQLSCEIKLRGSNRATNSQELVVNGPPVPTTVIRDLKLLDPVSGEPLEAIGAGTPYQLVGTVSVEGNSSELHPRLVVWGLMDNDVPAGDPFQVEPFSDQHWGWAQLDAANGKWRFAIDGRMPAQFMENLVSSQPFTFHIAAVFTEETMATELLKGTVLASGSGGLVSPDLDDRLIVMEANWDWDLERMR